MPGGIRRRIVWATPVTCAVADAILDALDATVALKLALGLPPLTVYQFVASGMLGQSAFAGGAA